MVRSTAAAGVAWSPKIDETPQTWSILGQRTLSTVRVRAPSAASRTARSLAGSTLLYWCRNLRLYTHSRSRTVGRARLERVEPMSNVTN